MIIYLSNAYKNLNETVLFAVFKRFGKVFKRFPDDRRKNIFINTIGAADTIFSRRIILSRN